MEKPTFTAIDYNSKENKVIEGLVRDNYSKIKNTFYRVFDKRSKNPNSPVGLCADIIEDMVKVTAIRDDDHKRILRCSEGNRVWYRLWINPEDMMRIEPLLEGGDRIWMEEIEMYYLFFYEIRNGRRLIGKNRVKKILDILL